MALIGNFSDPSASIMEQAKNGGDVTSQMKAMASKAGDPTKVAGNSMNTPDAQSLMGEQKAAAAAATEQANILAEVDAAQMAQNAAQQAQDMAADIAGQAAKAITDVLSTIKTAIGQLVKLASTPPDGSVSMPGFGGMLPSVSDIQGELGKMGDKLKETFSLSLPEESPIVQDTAEDLLNKIISTLGTAVIVPLKTITSATSVLGIPGVDMVANGLDSIVSMLQGVVTLASTNIPDEQLDALAAAKFNATGIAAGSAEAAKSAASSAGQTGEEAAAAAKDMADKQKALAEQQANAAAGAFKNMKPPKLPTSIMQQLDDMQKAVMQIVTNIPNILINIILGLIGKIFEVLNKINEILGAIPGGATFSIPDPLGAIPNIITDAIAIFNFIMGLPMTLVTVVKAIIIKKVKMLSLGLTPPAKLPKIDTPALPGGPSAESKGAQAMAKAQFDILAEFKSH